MDIQTVKTKDLKPYGKNAKKHPKEQVQHVANSIEQFGMVQPIVCDKDNYIVIGHCRWQACKKLKMEQVPVLYVEDLTDEQVNALRLADNKTNESEWDFDLLEESMAEIDGIDMADFGFDMINQDDFGEDFTLPDGEQGEIRTMTLTLHKNQLEFIQYAISQVEQTETFGNTNKTGNKVYEVFKQWAEQKK